MIMKFIYFGTILPLVQMTLIYRIQSKDADEHSRFGHRGLGFLRHRRHPHFGLDYGPGLGPRFRPELESGFIGRRRHHAPRDRPYGSVYAPPYGPPHAAPDGSPYVAPDGSSYAAPDGSSYAAPNGPPHAAPNGPPYAAPHGPPHGPPHAAPHGPPDAALYGPQHGPAHGPYGPHQRLPPKDPREPPGYLANGGNMKPADGLTFEDTQSNRPVLKFQTSCGVSISSRIIGGEEVQKDDWSWTVALMRPSQDGLEHFCGATIISDRHLITASHCIDNIRISDLSVRVGQVNLSQGDPSNDIKVEKLIKHPNFNSSTYFADIALVKLQSPVEFSYRLQPCCLPDDTDAAGQTGVVVGWGSTSFGGPQTQVLQQLSLPIWSNAECQSKISLPIEDVMLCAGRKDVGGHDACQGDSGGPLLVRNSANRWAVEGIVSFGFKCAQKGVPGIYTRVSKFKDWIVRNAD